MKIFRKKLGLTFHLFILNVNKVCLKVIKCVDDTFVYSNPLESIFLFDYHAIKQFPSTLFTNKKALKNAKQLLLGITN